MVNVDKPTTELTNSDKVGVFTGQATLVAGTKTVLNSSVRSVDNIFLSVATPGGTPGTLSIGTITEGVSFVINSSSNLDTSVINWQFNQ